MDNKLIIIANWIYGSGLSGGDRILIELARRWKDKTDITLCVSQDGYNICRKYGLDVKYEIWSKSYMNKSGFILTYFIRIMTSCFKALTYRLTDKGVMIYSASDFLPDSLPAFIMKLRNRQNKWIAGFYLFAQPIASFIKKTNKRKFRIIRDSFYYLSQKPAFYIINKYADCVFVTSNPDIEPFAKNGRNRNNIVVIRGGVDVKSAKEYKNTGGNTKYEYDACFLGRLHTQKGVIELIDIWREVVNEKSNAKLAIIGDGELKNELTGKISKLNLNKNVSFLGFKDSEEKYEIFRKSRIVLHPAVYDSGGMAAAEAMAWGLPAVGFDLPHLKEYYSKGMTKAEPGNIKEFANKIVQLLEDKNLYNNLSKEAQDFIFQEWDWNKRAEVIMNQLRAIGIWSAN